MRKRLVLTASLFLCMAVVAYAVNWQPYDYFDLSGGLNDAYSPISIADNEASDLQNVVFTTGKAVAKRSGTNRINTSPISSSAIFTGGFQPEFTSTSRFLVATVSDGATDRIYKMDYGGGTNGPDGTWDNITGALVPSFGTDDHSDFAVAMDTLVIEDGVNSTAPYKWTGSGNASALSGSANASFVEFHKNHLWTSGNDTNPSQIAFSELCAVTASCIETYTATDVINVETNDGTIVRGMRSALDCLYVWKDSSIWRVCGTNRDDWTLEQMVAGVGTLSDKSIAVINNNFLFVTQNCDIAVYNGGLNVEIISTKIEGTLSGLNLDRCDESVATAFDDGTGDLDYYVAFTNLGSSQNNLILVFDTFHTAWTKFSNMSPNALWTYEIGTQQTAIGFGDYTGTAWRYPNTNADDGTAINAYYQSGQLRFPEIPFNKIFRLAQVFLDQESGSTNVTFEHKIDFESTGTETTISLAGSGAVWDSAVYDTDVYADLTTTVGRVEINRGQEFFQWRIENAGASQPFTLKGVRLFVEPTERIGGIR